MARKSRRINSSPFLKFFLIAAVVVVSATFFTYQKAGVLGESTTVGRSTSTTPPTTKGGLVNKFTIYNRCGNDAYRNDTYVCANGQTYNEGGTTSCKSISLWFQYAKQRCQPILTPTPTKSPKPSKTPTPTIRRAPTPTRTSTPF